MLTLIAFLNQPVMSLLVKTWQGIPWWVGLILLPPLVLYAFVRATYQEYREVEQERDALQKRIKALEDQPPPRHASELKALCIHLGKDVAEFDSYRRGMPGDATEEEIIAHDRETIRQYDGLYKPRIMKLYGDLAPRGWFDDNDRELFDYVFEWQHVGEVAERLKTVGERLPDQ